VYSRSKRHDLECGDLSALFHRRWFRKATQTWRQAPQSESRRQADAPHEVLESWF
jgi:hypothetical protein